MPAVETQAAVLASALAALRAQGDAFTAALLARVPENGLRAVLAGGGFAAGDAWAARVDGIIEVYSDLDVFVVTEAQAVPEVRKAAADAVATLPHERDGVALLRPVEAGVFDPADFAAQPARPGTAGLTQRAVWFYGDASRTPATAAGAIAPTEALYLMENRSSELARVEGTTPREQRLAAILALKTRLDVATAHLIVSGRYAHTRAERARAVGLLRPQSLGDAALADVRDAFQQADNPGAWLAEAEVEQEIVRAREAAVRAWCEIAATDGGSLADRVRERAGAGNHAGNAREFMHLRWRARIGPLRALALGARFCSYSPRAALRLHAVAERIAENGDGNQRALLRPLLDYCDSLSAALGETTGTRARRAARALRVIA